jgi:hypothetical protein
VCVSYPRSRRAHHPRAEALDELHHPRRHLVDEGHGVPLGNFHRHYLAARQQPPEAVFHFLPADIRLELALPLTPRIQFDPVRERGGLRARTQKQKDPPRRPLAEPEKLAHDSVPTLQVEKQPAVDRVAPQLRRGGLREALR